MPLAPNWQLFEYRVVRILGQGAFGVGCLHRGLSLMECLVLWLVVQHRSV